ncbi:MAG TPA: ferric reductase-like transmembrane domain-containing protein [Rhodanobacter sp.]
MKNIKLTYACLLVVLTALWLAADTILSAPYEFFALRSSLVNYTGIIGMGVMSFAMMLAARPVRAEPMLGGLDKMYRLHKWLGITALVTAIIHWLWTQAPKWMVGWGWIARPVRGGPPPEQPTALFRVFQSQRGLAESIGEWAFYAAVVLIVLALVKRFPYRYFFQTHRLLAIVYLFLVFHSLVLMKFYYWDEAIGPLMAVLMTGGTVAAFVSLFRKVGHAQQAVAQIEEIVRHTDNRVLKVAIKLQDRWPGHAAGQFAFLTFDAREGPHPFTISSPWTGDGRMFFLIKELGDYTGTLSDTVKVGDSLWVEGPYGRFDFECRQPRQIWVAGGIGITPFVSRMQALAAKPDGRSIDLFYSTSSPDEGFIDKVRQAAGEANVRLHVLIDAEDGRLDARRIVREVPDWKFASVWFCGPAGFARALREDLATRGLSRDDFHQELFAMR